VVRKEGCGVCNNHDDGTTDYGSVVGDGRNGRAGVWGMFSRKKVIPRIGTTPSNDDEVGVLAYHRRYVHTNTNNDKTTAAAAAAVQQPNNEQTSNSSSSTKNHIVSDQYETRGSGNTQYTVPKIKTNNGLGLGALSVLLLVRELVLLDLDELVGMQKLENEFNERRERFRTR